MKKLFGKIWDDKRGTALITGLLVMGVFIAVSLALSTLILRELRITKESINAGKAFYAAESGIEEALYYLNNELPGWEVKDMEKNINEESDVKYSYNVKNTCSSYPCIDLDEYDEESVENADPLEFYDVLYLNENISIPMFTVEVDDEGEVQGVKSIKDFTVEFFAGFNPNDDLRIEGASISGWDVLRWKIYGMRNVDNQYITESINDFTAVSTIKNLVTGDTFSTIPTSPSWFGTKACPSDVDGRPNISCLDYPNEWMQSSGGKVCTNLQARDYYYYEGGEVVSVHDCYNIGDFMTGHQVGKNGSTGLNYLSLTNMVNPSMFNADVDNPLEKARIFFRVEAYDENGDSANFVREYADVTSDGYSGDMKQSINVKIKRDSYMPVFNFAIYSTYGE